MGRSSSKQGSKLGGGMEIDKVEKTSRREEPHLSGAYIRSLVKQLTSSRTKEPLNPKIEPEGGGGGGVDGGGDVFPAQNPTKLGQQPQQQQHKKQVRRRLHTSRPYQERLLNMAEARREIVTALKFHRAAMKQQANEQQQQANQQQQPPPQSLQSPVPSQPSSLHHQDEQEMMMMKSRRNNPRTTIYSSSTSANFSNYLDNISYSSLSSSYSTPNPPYSCWPASSIAPPSIAENFNLTLPNQALGLNLNIHDFNNIDATLYNNNNNNNSYYYNHPSLSPSSSSSPTLSFATTEEVIPNLVTISQEGPSEVDMTGGGGGLHPAMDDEEMAEIRSLGEQHDMEWNDRMNLVTSAWWFKFLKTMEIGPEVMSANEDDGYSSPFDQVMEFPSWLINANEGCLQQHFNDLCSDDYLQDPALPCMDIEEIEGMDGEWLA